MATLVAKLSKCCNYFLRLSGFPDLSDKVFLIIFKFSEPDYSTIFRNSNVNIFFLVSRDREIITVKSLKSKKKKLALTLFYYVSREIWLGNSKNLFFAQTSQDSAFSQTCHYAKMFNITSKYFTFFNNKLAACQVAHITRDFIACYSCSYYSST